MAKIAVSTRCRKGFAEDLFLAQGREAGVIVEFDTDLLWHSVAHFGTEQDAVADPVANLSVDDFQLFEVNAFRDAAIDRDPLLAAQRDAALGLLRALQTGELPASQVFDVEQYGRFLALVDLWGATQGTAADEPALLLQSGDRASWSRLGSTRVRWELWTASIWLRRYNDARSASRLRS